MKKIIVITLLCLVLALSVLGCGTQEKDVYAVVCGKFVANSPQLVDGYYTVFLDGVPDPFRVIYFTKESIAVYDHAIFGEENVFYLRLEGKGGSKWIATGVKNSNGIVDYWEPR